MSETVEPGVRTRSDKLRAAALPLALVLALALASGLSRAGSWWWVLDLLAHFHAIYFWLAVATAIALAGLRRRRLALGAAALAAFEAMLLLPLYAGSIGSAPDATPGAPRLRVVSYNMLHDNPGTAAAAAHIAALEPDVVVLMELTPGQLEVFDAALPGWHHVAKPRRDAFGIAVFTRTAPTRAELLDLGSPTLPSFEVELDVDGRSVALAAVHTPPPVSAAHSETRDRMLRALSSWAAAKDGPVLVLGDLNATPWSATMREILGAGPLRSTQQFGLQGTWPSFLGPLGIPIDHALVSGPLEPVVRRIEPAFGSDHRMLLVELELRPQ